MNFAKKSLGAVTAASKDVFKQTKLRVLQAGSGSGSGSDLEESPEDINLIKIRLDKLVKYFTALNVQFKAYEAAQSGVGSPLAELAAAVEQFYSDGLGTDGLVTDAKMRTVAAAYDKAVSLYSEKQKLLHFQLQENIDTLLKFKAKLKDRELLVLEYEHAKQQLESLKETPAEKLKEPGKAAKHEAKMTQTEEKYEKYQERLQSISREIKDVFAQMSEKRFVMTDQYFAQFTAHQLELFEALQQALLQLGSAPGVPFSYSVLMATDHQASSSGAAPPDVPQRTVAPTSSAAPVGPALPPRVDASSAPAAAPTAAPAATPAPTQTPASTPASVPATGPTPTPAHTPAPTQAAPVAPTPTPAPTQESVPTPTPASATSQSATVATTDAPRTAAAPPAKPVPKPPAQLSYRQSMTVPATAVFVPGKQDSQGTPAPPATPASPPRPTGDTDAAPAPAADSAADERSAVRPSARPTPAGPAVAAAAGTRKPPFIMLGAKAAAAGSGDSGLAGTSPPSTAATEPTPADAPAARKIPKGAIAVMMPGPMSRGPPAKPVPVPSTVQPSADHRAQPSEPETRPPRAANVAEPAVVPHDAVPLPTPSAAVPVPAPVAAAEPHRTARALYDYEPQQAKEMRLRAGDTVTVLKMTETGWWSGTIGDRKGWFPSDFVDLLPAGNALSPPKGASPQQRPPPEPARPTAAEVEAAKEAERQAAAEKAALEAAERAMRELTERSRAAAAEKERREEAARLERERLEKEQQEAARIEQERLEKERQVRLQCAR
eukprot:TRINITY_DN5483_c0_g2_i2.p1 TRINITY_DN5483_c0_g2~~TRINITY_DN5483_c0_g2_i2.p1  ORF type:complete len:776 (+),score=196.33 TRINITY_DN5483_c0_g2_i2:60-2387(+)